MAHKGGSETKGGFFWKKGDWEIVTVEGKRGVLPGTVATEYLRIPTILFVPVAMIISVAYVIFFPFVGFAMLAKVVTRKLRIVLRGAHQPVVENLATHAAGNKHTR
jgi:hypothetical protein